jgi:hypothetical protein
MERAERRVIRSINVGSAVRMSFALTASFWAIVLVGLIALYLLGLVSGGLGGVEGFIASLGFTGFRFTILPFALAFIVVAVLASAIVGLLAGVVALLYNHLHPLIGGLEVHTRER